MTRAYLGLGSNVGDRLAHLQAAVDGLRTTSGVEVEAVSRVYETDPVGPDQPDYLNAVVAVETALDARGVLDVVRRLEIDQGREPDPARRERWGPRPLDVDILSVGDEQVDEPDLVVPHPRIRERDFVLAPLSDVAPDHPFVGERRARDDRGWQGVRPTDVELVFERS